jgi:hypothetical protein
MSAMPIANDGSDSPGGRQPVFDPGLSPSLSSEPIPSMDVVASFLLERARHPSLDGADQQELEALLFAYLNEGFRSSQDSRGDRRKRG